MAQTLYTMSTWHPLCSRFSSFFHEGFVPHKKILFMWGRISCLPLQTDLLHVNLAISVLSPYSPAPHWAPDDFQARVRP